jgi:hypothetical protein
MSRGNLRLAALMTPTPPQRTVVMNVRLPQDVAATIDRLSATLRAPRTAVVLALLNEGLAVWEARTAAAVRDDV